MRSRIRRVICTLVALMLLIPAMPAVAQTKVKPGWNIFSPAQDVEIGRQSAVEAEQQLPLLRDARANDYINRLGQRLAASAPGEKYPYTFKLVNQSDINAFALPGGPIYINRGTIESAANEAELAGVVAHEIAHVVLRHGTNQASKAYLAQAGLAALGGFMGQGTLGTIVNLVGGFGLNAVFLKYGRNAETQADVLGAQMLAANGYDPRAMARFFETLQRESGRNPSKLEVFMSSHPPPADRSKRIEKEAALLGTPPRSREIGGFSETRNLLAGMPKAPSMADLAKNQPSGGSTGGRPREGAGANVRVEPPSASLRGFQQANGLYQLGYPDNWQAYNGNDNVGAVFAPSGGVVEAGGQPQFVYAVMINLYRPVNDPGTRRGSNFLGDARSYLYNATQEIVGSIQQGNSYLSVDNRQNREIPIAGRKGIAVTMLGRSPLTGRDERVQLVTRLLDNGAVFYLLFVLPNDEYQSYARSYEQMFQSLRINDALLR